MKIPKIDHGDVVDLDAEIEAEVTASGEEPTAGSAAKEPSSADGPGTGQPPQRQGDQQAEPSSAVSDETPVSGEDGGEKSSGGKGRKPKPSKPTVKLEDLEEFRRWQSARDQEQAEARRKIRELEDQLREQQTAAQRAALEAQREQLIKALGEAYNPADLTSLVDQYGQAQAQVLIQQMQEWERWKTDQIKAAGLDPDDSRFQKQYQGELGLMEFKADLAEAKAAKAEAAAKELREAASPDKIAELVRAEVAKVALATGTDEVDLGSPTTPASSEDQWEADLRRLQAGRMTPEAFHRKWSDKT